MTRTIIVAPNRPWALDYCRRQDLNPRSRDVVLITNGPDADKLLGLRLEDWHIEILGWPENIDEWHRIYETLLTRGWREHGDTTEHGGDPTGTEKDDGLA